MNPEPQPPKRKSNNPNGRPKGTPNKTTTELRQWVVNLLSKNRAKLERDLMGIADPSERWRVVTKILEMVLPKPTAQIDATITTEVEGMSRAELLAELARLEKLTDTAPDDAEASRYP